MKVYVKNDVSVWINGKELKVPQGIQDVDDEAGRILINAGYAYQINKEDSDAKETKTAKR